MGFLKKKKLANNPLELVVSLISAAATIGYIAYEAVERSREYKAAEERRKREAEATREKTVRKQQDSASR